ncbi:hypothetical protein [Devosia sp. SL43]|uniref:hypothetical protein n=1 Tax=Devosia sp. SL43 TaxID=2806348 RepID=UPI001F1C1219|nr:hypothetical protein [Devosia sp. SL43]UJW84259.1 hypothetical protein IM737_12520 [Devosia sp. SL43]
MADSKGNEPKPGDSKPVDSKPEAVKSGAVKPPVLDLKARATGTDAPESTPKPKPAEKPVEKPAASTAASAGGFPLGATIAGGALGLAAAYGLAFFGLWPAAPSTPVVADPRLAQFATAIPELETVTQTTQSELATLTQRVGALETAPAPAATAAAPTATDLGPVEADISALSARLDVLGTGEATPDGGIETLRTDLAALGTRLDELAARVGTAEAGLRTLDTTVTQTTATLADQPSDIGAVLQLPLILSGFETAFATGRPYETELATLRAAVPGAVIPTDIANAAATGLVRPDAIARRFDEVLPAMLAGRPADPNAQWQDGALDWLAAAVALRPTGEIEGDTPEAVMSRLVGAVERRDFANAATLLASLPAPMQAAAEDVPALIKVQAEAATFLETLRNQALSGEAAQ